MRLMYGGTGADEEALTAPAGLWFGTAACEAVLEEVST
jgi:hypothetical protein